MNTYKGTWVNREQHFSLCHNLILLQPAYIVCRECSVSVRYTPLLIVLRLAAPIVTCLESRGAKCATSWSWISVSPSWLRSSDSPLAPEVTPTSKIKELMSESLCVLFGLSRWLETPKQCSELYNVRFESSLNISTLTGSKNLLSAIRVVWN